MRSITLFIALFCFLASPAVEAATLDKMAGAVVRQLDRQVVERLGQGDSPAQGVSLFVTTPVDLNDLSESNALARQMQEDLARGFVELGYCVQEIRKGASLVFDQSTGEMLLTRDVEQLSSTQATAGAVLAGTYTVTPRNVRFNIKLIHTGSLEAIAMASITVPLTGDLVSLVGGQEGAWGIPIEPTVVTRLP